MLPRLTAAQGVTPPLGAEKPAFSRAYANRVMALLALLAAFEYAYYVAVFGFVVAFVLALFAQEVMGKNASKHAVVE